jgi:integrase/recombinase XerD
MFEQLNDFLNRLKEERNYSENTTVAYRNDLNQFFQYMKQRGMPASWAQVNQTFLEQYVQNMKEQPYASSSVARKVAAIKSFFEYLVAQRLLDENPAADLQSPKVEKRLPHTLSAAEVDRLLLAPRREESPKNLRDTALLALLYATGMRVTEVVTLKLDDLDLDGRILHCAGKDGSMRQIPVDAETVAILQRYLTQGRPHLLKSDEEMALFLNHRGQQLTRQGLWLIIKAYAQEAGLTETVTPHTMRHSFAAHKLESGSDLKEVQQLLGHANISTTQIYKQLDGDDGHPAAG